MFRVGKKPVIIPDNILVLINKNEISISKGDLIVKRNIHCSVVLSLIKNKIYFSLNKKNCFLKMKSCVGTYRSIINNIIIGMNKEFKKHLCLVGVGYKALVEGNILKLNLGFSHVVQFLIPKFIKINCISQTEIVIFGYDKQLVGQTAAKIRLIKPPESYKKGKGIRYLNENVRIKENKKKVK